jgi:FkbM family methyltransferase
MTEERSKLMADAAVSLVLDVGANTGQYATSLRLSGYRGDIISFEPLRDAYAGLHRAAADDPRWQTMNVALGASPERVPMHISANSYSSSFLPITSACIDAAPEAAYVGEEHVDVVTLDSLDLPEHVAILLKADVQGYEPEVLRGATRLLERTALLELELSLVPLYYGQELVHEVCASVRRAGFVPVAVGNPFCHPETGEILSIDGLFRRANF